MKRMYIDEILTDYDTGYFTDNQLRQGDTIKFLPCLYIDYHEDSKVEDLYFLNVTNNIYEFIFKPIKKFESGLHENCYHYILEVGDNLRVFHFNFLTEYEKYLQLDQCYSGFGKLRCSAGDPSMCNDLIDPTKIKAITQKAVLNNIIVEYNDRDYLDVERDDDLKNPYYGLGYPHDFDRFKQSLSQYKPIKELSSTAEKDDLDRSIFEVDLMN